MQNNNFRYINDWAIIRLADSFVKINKAGTGNGEAALYLGSKQDIDIFRFFECENFDAHCIMFKDDIIDYLEQVKIEYIHNCRKYRNEVSLRTWNDNYKEVCSLPEELYFDLTRKRQFDKHGRVYAQELSYKRASSYSILTEHKAYVYDLIRRIAIPEVSYLLLTKITDNDSIGFNAKLYYDPILN
jgi:hypothetical protein